MVVIAILALLISILLPSLKRAKELAREAICATNSRSLLIAQQQYATQFTGHLMPSWWVYANYRGLQEWFVFMTYFDYLGGGSMCADFEHNLSAGRFDDFSNRIPTVLVCPSAKNSNERIEDAWRMKQASGQGLSSNGRTWPGYMMPEGMVGNGGVGKFKRVGQYSSSRALFFEKVDGWLRDSDFNNSETHVRGIQSYKAVSAVGQGYVFMRHGQETRQNVGRLDGSVSPRQLVADFESAVIDYGKDWYKHLD